MSANGSAAARPATASWNAPSMSSSDSASTIVPPCTSGSKPGLAVNSGSRSTATFTFTVPLRDLPALDALDEVGRAARRGRSCSRNVIFGCVAATTTSARSSSPDSSVTPRTRPLRTSMRATAASVRTVAPFAIAASRSARLTAPMPPSGKPHEPSWPSPTSPILWCAITYAVPAERGPGPRADDAAHREHALHLRRREVLVEQVGDAHREQAGDVGDAVARRARAAATRAEPGRRGRRACASRRVAGSSSSNGPSTSARLPSHASHRSYASASALRELRDLRVPARGIVVGELQRAAVAVGREVAVLRVHLVAVRLELELAHDRRRHEADDVRERGHVEVGAPRLLGRGRAADLRAPFEHRDARAAPREQARGDEPVVPAADDDDVERLAHDRELIAATCSSSGRQVSSAGRRARRDPWRARRRAAARGSRRGRDRPRAPRSRVGRARRPARCSVSMLRGLSRRRYAGSVATR